MISYYEVITRNVISNKLYLSQEITYKEVKTVSNDY